MLSMQDKNVLNTSVFSPIRFNDNPAHHTSIKYDTISIRQCIKSIVKTLVDNHRKWDEAHRRGIVLCKAIDKCKLHAIKLFTNADTNPSDRTLYPDELHLLCNKLQLITTILEDIRDSANESRRQIVSLFKLSAENAFAESGLVFQTWTCKTIESAVNKICASYEEECSIKFSVMENIAHSRSDNELAWHVAVWEYQTYVDTTLDVIVRALRLEAEFQFE